MAAHVTLRFLASPYFGTRATPSCQSSTIAKKASAPVAVALARSSPSPSAEKAKSPKSPRGAGLKKPMDISPALQQFLGTQQASRADTMKLVWDYIKKHELQSETDRRLIVCDEKLKALLGKDRCNFLEIAKLINPHFVKST